MADKTPIHSVEISTIAHATEDPAKVEIALRKLSAANLQFTRRYLEGHHGNPIVKFDSKLTDNIATQVARSLIVQLSNTDRLRIERDLTLYSDAEGNLYIRIDKQTAFHGRVQLGGDDPIRIKIKFNRLTGKLNEIIPKFLELG